MGVDKFLVEVDNVHWDYRPGETINGRVHLTVSDQQNASEIIVRFFGEAQTHFQLTEKATPNSTVYSSVEYLFDVPITLFGGNRTLQPITPGDHLYPFVFTVPGKRFPEPCDLEDGHIKYGIQATMLLGGKDATDDLKTEIVPIFFDATTDLSDFPFAGIPLVVEESRVFDKSCCCSKGKPVIIQTSTVSHAYRLGETVLVNVKIDNAGSTPISKVTAALVQLWTITGGKREKTLTVSLEARGREGLPAGETGLMDFSFVIPHEIPVSIDGFTIIKLTYGVQVDAAVQDKSGKNTQSFKVLHPIVLASPPKPETTIDKIRKSRQTRKIFKMVREGIREYTISSNKSSK